MDRVVRISKETRKDIDLAEENKVHFTLLHPQFPWERSVSLALAFD